MLAALAQAADAGAGAEGDVAAVEPGQLGDAEPGLGCFVHAAVLAALLDVVCGRNCAERAPSRPHLLTVSLTVDNVAVAQDGDWLEASATVTRAGRRLAFADGRVEAAGNPCRRGQRRVRRRHAGAVAGDEFSAVPPS